MAVSLTEWRFARPADALPPALARGPRSFAFCATYLPTTYLRNVHHRSRSRVHTWELETPLYFPTFAGYRRIVSGWRNRRTAGEVTSPRAITTVPHTEAPELYPRCYWQVERQKEREREREIERICSRCLREYRKITFFHLPEPVFDQLH